MAESVIITYYAITSAQLRFFENKFGEPLTNLVVSSLRGNRVGDLLKCLRSQKFDTIYLLPINSGHDSFLSILHLVAFLPSSRRVMVVAPDHLSLRPIRRFSIMAAVFSLAYSTLSMLLLLPFEYLLRRRLAVLPAVTPTSYDEARQILYLETSLSMDGDEESIPHTVGNIEGLRKKGFSISYVSPSIARELDHIPEVSVHSVISERCYTYSREINAFHYDRTVERWSRPLLPQEFSLIYNRMSLNAITAVRMSRRLKIPLVLEYNGSKRRKSPLRFPALSEVTEEACLRHAHLLVVVSEPLRQELISRGVNPERIIVQPNGVNTDTFDPARFTPAQCLDMRHSLGIAEDAVIATFVGTSDLWHGAEILAQALIDLSTAPDRLHSSKLHVLFIDDGIRHTETQAALDAVPALAGRHTFVGAASPGDIPRLLAMSDIFVAPHVPDRDGTAFFGLPTKMFEYLAMGRPTVASALEQLAEIMDRSPSIAQLPALDGPCDADQVGLLVTPGHVEELAQALYEVAHRPIWRRSAGLNARQRALQRYTWSSHADNILAALYRLHPMRERAPSPCRILVNAVHAKSGGGVTYLNNILPRLARQQGVSLELVIQEDQREIFTNLCTSLSTHLLPTVPRLRTVFWQEQITIPALAKRLGADVVFSPANYGPIPGKHNVIVLRNAFQVATLERRLSKRIYWLAVRILTEVSFRFCRRAIAVSRHAANDFLRAFGMTQDARLAVVHHGVSPLFSPPPENAERVPGRLLAVSDIYVQKNLETLIAAMPRLIQRWPHVQLYIVGRQLDKSYYMALTQQCDRLEVSGNIRFLGGLAAAQVAEHYRQAQVFVFPSLVETFGNPLLEAMASGTPIVCAKSAALPEIAADAALFATPGDSGDLADKIAALLENPGLAKDLATRGLQRVKLFSWDRCAESTARILRLAAKPTK